MENQTNDKLSENLNEDLLHSWLKITTAINNTRVVSDLTFNESIICNLLYFQLRSESTEFLTATDLCREMKMLKSQMNRTLNELEEQGLIKRTRSEVDKRKVYITLVEDKNNAYFRQHEKIIRMMDRLIEKIGAESAKTMISVLNELSEAASIVF